ncbi:Acetyltransferase (GNAT) family protein [Desulfuromusa kysingii]|uniref:Acetyltransferase (GNAT) family protein n=1 Tax=Desulfuromusa kysingii TaxID=37625 RepID=A0A1H3XBA7_9BACT|nr:GNAT family N-acetyltransferase [Desulfuromusa kysingii]SDZ96231.1 Acetyltransferase (GNAT) family protein [Desulfuromusa kysingii]
MHKLQPADMSELKGILNRLRKIDVFTSSEVECAVELLQIVLDQPEQRDYQVLVTSNDDRPVGYILYGPIPLTDGNFDIYWIATDPKIHGKGFGRELIESAEFDMQQQGARMICLETSSKEAYLKTRNFYEKSGYRKESVIADFYNPGDDRITYIKRFS